eukprot:jgi/Botrbrau1/21710/Bobra.43_1s0105.1
MVRSMHSYKFHWKLISLLFFLDACSRAGVSAQDDSDPVPPSVIADPVIRPFGNGPEFLFNGTAGGYYDLMSDASDLYSIVFLAKLGIMHDHNGTYMEAIGVKYGTSVAIVEITEDSEVKVDVNGVELLTYLRSNNTASRMVKQEQGDMLIDFRRYAPVIGQVVYIVTDEFDLDIVGVSAGELDEGGVQQPSYLNLQSCRIKLEPPSGYLQGVLGETYPSTAGPFPLLFQQPDGKMASINRTHPLQPDQAYERKGFPNYLEALPQTMVGRAMFGAGGAFSKASRTLPHQIVGAALSRVTENKQDTI